MSKEQNLYSEKCFSDEVIDENCFVGIHFKDGNFDIKYPLGYRISEDEKENKKDIINLINDSASESNIAVFICFASESGLRSLNCS